MFRKVVSVAVFSQTGKLLFGRRRDDSSWTLPGGHLNVRENIEAGAVRELFEETGILVHTRDLTYLGEGVVASKKVKVYSFRTVIEDEVPTNVDDPDNEISEFKWVDVSSGLPAVVRESLHNYPDITLSFVGLYDDSMQKSLRGLVGGGLAAVSLAIAPIAMAAEPTVHVGWTVEGLHKDLQAIAHLESSSGKNVKHVVNSKGEYHTAHGALGLKPVTAHEEYKRTKKLQSKFPGFESEAAFTNEFKSNPNFYNAVAMAHWDRLRRVTGSGAKAAFAWRWGVGAAAKATAEDVSRDNYVSKFLNLNQTVVPQVVSTAKAAAEVLDLRKDETEAEAKPVIPPAPGPNMLYIGNKWCPLPEESELIEPDWETGFEQYLGRVERWGGYDSRSRYANIFKIAGRYRHGERESLMDASPFRIWEEPSNLRAFLAVKDPELLGRLSKDWDDIHVKLDEESSKVRNFDIHNKPNAPWLVRYAGAPVLTELFRRHPWSVTPEIIQHVLDTRFSKMPSEEWAHYTNNTYLLENLVKHKNITPEQLEQAIKIAPSITEYYAPSTNFHKLSEDRQLNAVEEYSSSVSFFFNSKSGADYKLSDRVIDRIIAGGNDGLLMADGIRDQITDTKLLEAAKVNFDSAMRAVEVFAGVRPLGEDVISTFAKKAKGDQLRALYKNKGWNPAVHNQIIMNRNGFDVGKMSLLGEHGTPEDIEKFLPQARSWAQAYGDHEPIVRMLARLPPDRLKAVLEQHWPNTSDFHLLKSPVHNFDVEQRKVVLNHAHTIYTRDSHPDNFYGDMKPVLNWLTVRHGQIPEFNAHALDYIRAQMYGDEPMRDLPDTHRAKNWTKIESVLLGSDKTPIEALAPYLENGTLNQYNDLRHKFAELSDDKFNHIYGRVHNLLDEQGIEPELQTSLPLVKELHQLRCDRHPDALFKESTNIVHWGSNRYGLGRLRELRDFVQARGGTISKRSLGNQLPDVIVKAGLLDGKGNLSADRIQSYIDSLTTEKFNVSHATWDGGQRHNMLKSQVLQVNLSNDHVQKMRDAGVYGTFKNVYKASHRSGHPVLPQTIGWIRYTPSYKKGESSENVHMLLANELEDNRLLLRDKIDKQYLQRMGVGKFFRGEVRLPADSAVSSVLPVWDFRTDRDEIIAKYFGNGTYNAAEHGNALGAVIRDAINPDPGNLSGFWGNSGYKAAYAFQVMRKLDPTFHPEIDISDQKELEFHGLPAYNNEERELLRFASRSPDSLAPSDWDKLVPFARKFIDPDMFKSYESLVNPFPPEGFFVDEIQSDFGQSLVRAARAQAREQGEDEDRVEEKAKKEWPDEHLKKIGEILFHTRHPNETLFSVFHQHLRDKGHVGTQVHIWSPDSKGAISVTRHDEPLPGHMQNTYRDIPEKHGFKPAVYGDLAVQDNSNHVGKTTFSAVLRKEEEDLEKALEGMQSLSKNIDFKQVFAIEKNRKRAIAEEALNEDLSLDHYSITPHLTAIDPKQQGLGWTGAEKKRPQRIPRSYYYLADSKPESEFQHPRYVRYRVVLPKGNRLYDMDVDHLGLMDSHWEETDSGMLYKPADLDEVEKSLKSQKYAGYKNYNPSIPHAVVLFKKMPAQQIHHPNAPKLAVLQQMKKAEGAAGPDPKMLVQAVRNALTSDLRHPKYQTHKNPMVGHCYVASQALWHLLGGPKSDWTPMWMSHEGDSHWFLQHKASGQILDPTVDQFESPPPYKRRARVSGGWDTNVGPVPKGFLTGMVPDKRTQVVLERILGPMEKSEEFETQVAVWLKGCGNE